MEVTIHSQLGNESYTLPGIKEIRSDNFGDVMMIRGERNTLWLMSSGQRSTVEITPSGKEVESPLVEPDRKYLLGSFLDAMNDIGALGEEKYRDQCFHAMVMRGDRLRRNRTRTLDIITHILWHARDYELGTLHDHFHTRRHQLAAIAFNAMMEFYYLEE